MSDPRPDAGQTGEGLTLIEEHALQLAHQRDAWAGEWNSVPTAMDRILAARARAARAENDDLRQQLADAKEHGRRGWEVHAEHVGRMNALRLHDMAVSDEKLAAARAESDRLREAVEALAAQYEREAAAAPRLGWGLAHALLASDLRALLATPADAPGASGGQGAGS